MGGRSLQNRRSRPAERMRIGAQVEVGARSDHRTGCAERPGPVGGEWLAQIIHTKQEEKSEGEDDVTGVAGAEQIEVSAGAGSHLDVRR